MGTQSPQNEKTELKKLGNPAWEKGKSGNPKGRPPAGQGLKDRLSWWLLNKTVDEIERLVNDKKKWGKLVAADAHCAMVVHEGCKNTGLTAIAFIFDRLLGKAPQAITGEDGKPLMPAADVNEIARRTAFLLSLPQPAAAITIDQPAPAALKPAE